MTTRKAPSRANFRALRRYSDLSYSNAYDAGLYSTTHKPSVLSAENEAYDQQLTVAITDIRRKIMDEELLISQLKSQHTIPDIPPAQRKLHKLKGQKAAYDAAFQTIDYVPPATSPLNLLLAYTSVTATIRATRSSLQNLSTEVATARTNLAAAESTLKDQHALTKSLRARLEELESQQLSSKKDSPLALVSAKTAHYSKKTARLMRELTDFIDTRLSLLVAAEEMGGPVVGQDLTVSISTGFNKHGKARKGERRIDEMWGQGQEGPEEVAGREVKELLEELMNATLEGGAGWIELKQDCAAARFLVRAKVATLHGKDARKVRLVEFGRDVEDG